MKDKLYTSVSSVLPLGEVLDQYLADLSNAITDARNQAENGSQMGVTIAVGAASNILEHINATWTAIKK